MAPGSAISMMFYQTQLSKIMVIFYIFTKVYGCPDSKDFILSVFERNIYKCGKEEEMLNRRVECGTERDHRTQ